MSRDEKVNAEAGEGSVFVEEVRVGGQYSVLGRGGERGLEAMNGEGGLGGGGGAEARNLLLERQRSNVNV